MAYLKDIMRRERPRHATPFYDIETWFEDALKTPFSLLGPSIVPDVSFTEMYEVSPAVDIYEEANEVVMKADLPGMKKEDIKIDLSENFLTISGEKRKAEKLEKGDYYRYERSCGTFCRRFELPGDLDIEKIKAHFEDGILEVRIPMTAVEKKHKEITID